MSSARPPTPERFLDALAGFQRTSVVCTALELDVFTAVGQGARTAEALARACSASPRGIRALADYLDTLGLLSKSGAEYALPPDSALFLDRRSPEYLGDAARFLASTTVVAGFAQSAAAVRDGGTGAGLDSMAPEHPVWVEYARAMAPLFRGPSNAVAEILARDPRPVRRALDLAAGHGLFGVALAHRLPEVEVTALDWPAVLPIAREHATRAGVESRFHVTAGNVFEVPFGTGWDVIFLANFLHHFDARRCTELLGRVHAALAPRGRVVIVEFVPNPDRVTPPLVAQFAMTMLATTRDGDLYTFEELEAMLRPAGFRGVERHSLPGTPQRALVAER
ncbi:MAG: methyltransferase domain-containing protein [Thermoplasmata archaeon]|nr:methyltransferase domain-containing protein [Thermoplasmata archaeon]